MKQAEKAIGNLRPFDRAIVLLWLEIVNENLIRQSIRNRISEINRSAVVAVFAGVFVVLVGSAYFLTLELPESFVVVTDILFLWVAWMIYLCLSIGSDELLSFALGGTLGAFIGCGFGIRKNRQVNRALPMCIGYFSGRTSIQ